MTAEDTAKTEEVTHALPEAKGPERRIGPYKLLRELGHGGMGTVFLAARADEQYHKLVALKVIRGLDSEEVVRHFRRERQILASLDHPNIAKLLDGGTTEDGLPYFVMEHVEGQPIDVYCDRLGLPTAERLRLFRSVCSAVQYAHRNLVVHRDLKPANVLVTSEGLVKLLDFGIAKLLNPAVMGEAPTATQMALTPEYASPEQARSEPITTATDVYSLGVVLYELLTGHRAYRLKSLQPLEVLRAVVEEEPDRPSLAVGRAGDLPATLKPGSASRAREETPERLRRQLQGDLDNIVLTALRKEPQKRYPSVEAFSEDVRRHLEGLPVLARKGTLAYRAGKFVKRHALGVTAAAALVVLIAGLGINMAVQSARVSRALEKAEKERAKAERVSSFLVELFSVSNPSESRGNTITAREVLDKGAERIAGELKDQPEVRATLMQTMGNVYVGLGLYDTALPLLEEALATHRQVYGDEHAEVAASLHNLGNVLADRGDAAGAEAVYRKALEQRRKLLGQDHIEVARTLYNLAVVLWERGDYAGAEDAHRQALALKRRALGNDAPTVANSLIGIGLVLSDKGDQVGAEALHREALAMNRRLHGNDHPNVAHSQTGLAHALMRQGRLAEAEAAFREGLQGFRKTLPPTHPHIADPLAGLGEVLLEKGDPKGAAPLLREAVGILEKSQPEGHPSVAEGRASLAGCLTALSTYPEAEALLLQSYPTLVAKRGAHSFSTRKALRRLVDLYEAWGRPEKAREYSALLAGAPPAAATPK